MKKIAFLTVAAVAIMTATASCGQNAPKQATPTETTQDDIESRFTKDILALPEMKFEHAAIQIVSEPSAEEPYYTVKGGSNLDDNFATSIWFHVYTTPKYEIKVYDIIMDEEMTLEEYRNQ